MKVVSNYTLVAAGERVTAGKIVEIDNKEAKSLIKRRLARQPTEEDVVRSRAIEQKEADAAREAALEDEDDSETGEDRPISDLKRDELEARAKELDIDVAKIKGSGKGGNVLNADLVKAIGKAEAQAEKDAAARTAAAGAASDAGQPAGTATANPSLA